MKTIFRIVMILLVAGLVAGAFSLAVNNSSIASTQTGGEGQPPAMTDASGQPIQRPEGEREEGGSVAGGLLGVLGTLAKLTGVTVLVLGMQKLFNMAGTRKSVPA